MDAVKVLVTGAKGFIGKAVCNRLEVLGHKAVAFDLPNDICDRAAVNYACAHVDAAINLAGVLGTAEMIGEEYAAAQANILGAINIMDACEQFHLPLVQIATGHEGQPNPYAITKKCASDLALARAQWTGAKFTVVKAYHVYGPGQKMCAPHGPSKVRKIIPSFLARALTGMPIEVNGSGNQKIDLVYLDDVAKVIVDGLYEGYGQKLEAGTGVASRVIDVANEIAYRLEGGVEHIPMRAGEPEETTVVAENPLCPHPWPYKLDETIAWYRQALANAGKAD
jgi:nucleoside-diphosphate-sugar epimerase